jgi:hypothetical protein
MVSDDGIIKELVMECLVEIVWNVCCDCDVVMLCCDILSVGSCSPFYVKLLMQLIYPKS